MPASLLADLILVVHFLFVLFYDMPEWAFTVVYCAFAVAVVWAWRAVPPRAKSASGSGA